MNALPQVLVAFLAAGSAARKAFAGIAGLYDVITGSRHRRIISLADRTRAPATPPSGLIDLAQSLLEALGSRLGPRLLFVTDRHLVEAGFRADRQSRIDGEVSKQEAKAQLIIAACFIPAVMLGLRR